MRYAHCLVLVLSHIYTLRNANVTTQQQQQRERGMKGELLARDNDTH